MTSIYYLLLAGSWGVLQGYGDGDYAYAASHRGARRWRRMRPRSGIILNFSLAALSLREHPNSVGIHSFESDSVFFLLLTHFHGIKNIVSPRNAKRHFQKKDKKVKDEEENP